MESGREFGPREDILSEREALRVNFVSKAEAKRILCHYALGDACGSFDPDVNLDGLLQICRGVPTLLIIAGYLLRRRGNTSSACNQILQSRDIVQIALQQLQNSYRDAFLDIAFYFYGWDRSKVADIAFYFYGWDRSKVADIVGEMNIRKLEEAALVTTSEEGKVMMHDIVRARATYLQKVSYPRGYLLDFQKPLCIVLRDQDIATDEGLINVSDTEGLLDMNEGLLDMNEGLLDIDEGVNISPVDRNIWEPLKVLYVINLKESSLRVVVIYKVSYSEPAKTILAIAVFNLDRKLFKDKDYGCHYCGFWMDKEFKLTIMSNMEARSRSDFLNKKIRVYFYKAVLFINRALKIVDANSYRVSYLPRIYAPSRNHLRLPLRRKILVTARQLNEKDIFGHPDGIQVCSHRVYFTNSDQYRADTTLLYHYASLQNASYHLLNHLTGLLEICEGIPCILKIAGYELRRRGDIGSACREMVEEIEDLKQLDGGGDLPERMVDIVYRQLGKDSQDAFMDIAFYFDDWERSKVADIVGEMEVGEVERAALLTTSEEGKVKMDDIVRARGRTLSEGNRIRDWESLRLVLTDPQLPESLQLRCLEVRVPESLQLVYESDFLPSLRIKGHFNSLAESLGSFSCLKILKLNACSQLKKLPQNIGNLSSLKILDLDNCFDLESLDENVGNLSSLLVLNIRNCSKLKILPGNIGNLSSLQRLDMSNCSRLDTLPENIGNLSSLKHLDMSNCSKMERLPENIGNLSSLLHLDMSNCSKLDTLPENIGNLSSLKHLDMNNCSKMERLPENIGNLSCLLHLNMSDCSKVERLPENIGNLSSLRHLDMTHCSMLLTLPQSFDDIMGRRKCAVFLPAHLLPTND